MEKNNMRCAHSSLRLACKRAGKAAAVFLTGLLFLVPVTGHCAQARARIFCPDCNVIMVSLDTLRADALGIYGYHRDTSPNIDRLARRGAVFLNAYSQAPNTFPSHMSVFTSKYPWTHRVETIFRDRLATDIKTLPMIMKKQGYRTVWAAFMKLPYLSLTAGFERGFDDFVSPAMPGVTWETAFSWLKKNRGRKFFMFLHTYRIHAPYMPEKSSILRFSKSILPSKTMTFRELFLSALRRAAETPSRFFYETTIKIHPEIFDITDLARKHAELEKLIKNDPRLQQTIKDSMMDTFWEYFDLNSPGDIAYLRTLYDAGVFEADMAIGSLYARLEDLGLADNTLLVITSDHGEEFMEHGQVQHNRLYNEHLHVPLIFVLPGKRIGVKPAQIVQSIDITPTILDVVGLPALAGAEGRSLRPLMEGGESDGNSMAFAKRYGNYSVRDSRYTYIRNHKCSSRFIPGFITWNMMCKKEEFYDRAGDPGEKKNIFSSNRDAAGKLAGRLDNLTKSAGIGGENSWPAEIPDDVRKKILATGYW
ncbi:MAG: sulfatase [bacterium]